MYLIFYRTPEDEKVKEWKYGSTKEELKKYAEEQGLIINKVETPQIETN